MSETPAAHKISVKPSFNVTTLPWAPSAVTINIHPSIVYTAASGRVFGV